MLPITLHTTKQDTLKQKKKCTSADEDKQPGFSPVIFTFPSGFYWQEPDREVIQQSESVVFDASH